MYERRNARPGAGGQQENAAASPDLDRAWFELDLLATMAAARGWAIGVAEWHAGKSKRVRQLEAEGALILAADDPPAALEAWTQAR